MAYICVGGGPLGALTGLVGERSGEGTNERPRARSCCRTSGAAAVVGDDDGDGDASPPRGVVKGEERGSGPLLLPVAVVVVSRGLWRCLCSWRRRWWRARATRSCVCGCM